jgi:periplasmic protein CpxP/Spy
MSNFTNNRWLYVITLLLLTANIVTLAILWINKKTDRGERELLPPPTGQVFEFLTNELKLDAAQQEAYKKLRDEHQAGQRSFQENIGKAKDNFFELLQQTNVTDSTLQLYSKKVGEFEQQRDIFTFRHFQKLRALCNKEQQNKFDNIIQEVLRRMGRPKGQPGVPPPGMEIGDRRPTPPQ